MSDTPTTEANGPVVIPPYVSTKTFWGFVDSLKQGVPTRIDRTMMGNQSGATQSQLMSALKYLRLITDGHQPTKLLKELVATESTERVSLVAEMLYGAYPFLENDFLATATTGTLYDELRKLGASGDTLRKCLTFLIPMAREGGFTISAHVKNTKSISTGGTGKKRAPRQKKGKDAPEQKKEHGNEPPPPPETTGTMGQIMAGKMPDFDPTWPAEAQANWLAMAKMLMEADHNKKA